MTDAQILLRLSELTAELRDAKQQYAELYKLTQSLKQVAEEAVGMLNTPAALHEKKSQ